MPDVTTRRAASALAAGCLLAGFWVAGSGCARSGDQPPASGSDRGSQAAVRTPGTGSAVPGSDRADAGSPEVEPPVTSERAQVEHVLLAHRVRSGEPLAVRLLGTIGPDGSWALDSVLVRQEPGRVVIEPRVRRVPGDFFIQMVIPLDHTVAVELPAGEYKIEVREQERTLDDTILVGADVQRAAPAVRLAPATGEPLAAPGGIGVYTRSFRAEVEDGWIDRVEVREIVAGRETPWRVPEAVERDGAALQGTITVRQAPGDPERRLEVRAVDGQGAVSQPAEFVLPAR